MEVAGRREGDDGENQDNRANKNECEACKGNGVTNKADGLCIECEEFMCKKCFKDHLKAKQCRNHVIDTSFPNNLTFKRDFEIHKCKRHQGEVIRFYCRKHETVGCGECMIPDHGGCSPENIKDLCKEFRYPEEFAGLERNIEAVDSLSKENSTAIQENRNANAEMYEKALNGIKQFRKDINKFLDNAETTIIQEAKEVSDSNDTHLTKLQTDYVLQSSRIAAVRGRQLDPDLYSESGLFIQTVILKSIIRDLHQDASRLRQENNIKQFNFVPDTQLQSLTKSLHNFGKICCSSSPSRVSEEETTKLQELTPTTLTGNKKRLDADMGKENRIINDLYITA